MNLDLRVVFLFLLAVTAFLFILRRGAFLSLGDILQIIVDFFLVLAVSGTVIVFGFLLTRTDPMPMIRNLAYRMSFNQLVSFEHAIPTNLEENLAASNIMRIDTDGDNYNEWVVFYQFDLRGSSSPVKAMIYDNDRGNPPIFFPYALTPPHRDYLSEGGVSFELENVTVDENGPTGNDLDEILVKGPRELGIFRFRQNSETWDFPRDAPPRYQPLGFFRGSGGVGYDSDTKNVTVLDRGEFERSQLVNRSVYALNQATHSYWDQFYAAEELDRKLAAPIISTIDFSGSSPANILDTTFPEKIVLAFYASTCGSQNQTLCRHADANWPPQAFLDPNGDAFTEYKNNNPAYFGLADFNGTPNISARFLRYYPQLETDPDLQVTGGGRDVVTGEQAQFDIVEITFSIKTDISREEEARYAMVWVDGQWKISRRVPLDKPALGEPTQLQTNPQ